MTLTVEDLKRFQQQHPDYRLELVDGAIIVMSPSGFESDEIAAEIFAQLRNWVRPRQLGRVTASSAGFKSKLTATKQTPSPCTMAIASPFPNSYRVRKSVSSIWPPGI
jgi:Uma2 family endonuclease